MGKKVNKTRISFKAVLSGVMVMALAIGLVFNYLSLNEVSAKLNKATGEYEQLVSREQSLNYEIGQKVNFKNIEQLATDRLGMVKLESYQIQHVDLVEADNMSVYGTKEDNTGLMNNIIASFSILVEYLK